MSKHGTSVIIGNRRMTMVYTENEFGSSLEMHSIIFMRDDKGNIIPGTGSKDPHYEAVVLEIPTEFNPAFMHFLQVVLDIDRDKTS